MKEGAREEKPPFSPYATSLGGNPALMRVEMRSKESL